MYSAPTSLTKHSLTNAVMGQFIGSPAWALLNRPQMAELVATVNVTSKIQDEAKACVSHNMQRLRGIPSKDFFNVLPTCRMEILHNYHTASLFMNNRERIFTGDCRVIGLAGMFIVAFQLH